MESLLKNRSKKTIDTRPEIFSLANSSHYKKMGVLLKNNANIQIVDDFTEQLQELFAINNPPLAFKPNFKELFEKHLQASAKKQPLWQMGKWVYFPWLQTITHILNEADFFSVRTARNKMLITKQEQEKFYQASVGIAGLSIGSSVAIALVLQGGAKNLKLADFDRLALSNTNRIRAGVQNLGLPKVEMAARQIYETNPYAKLEIFPEGLNEQNIKKFVNGLDVLVDEMDSLSMKLLLRMEAKKQKTPIVMGADNGDMAVVDVERHDKKQKVEFFHGRVKNLNLSQLKNLNKFETGKTIAGLIGLENHTERMLMSLQEMGKSVVSWPQLGGTAILNGAAVAYCVRKIVCDQSVTNGRGIVSLDGIFGSSYFSKKEKASRKKTVLKFKKIFGI